MSQNFTLTTAKIRVSFRFEKDRFAHAVLVQRGQEWVETLNSCESGSSENWPSSPPLQEIHEHDPGVSYLAVGGAGTSHWSATVERVADGRIRFDFACRLSQNHDFLGNNYQFSDKLGAVEFADHCFSADGLEIRANDLTELTVSSNGLMIAPKVKDARLPTTIRWKYELISVQPLGTS